MQAQRLKITLPYELAQELERLIPKENVEDSEKLIKLNVDLGEENPRQILAGVKQWYKPEDLVGKQVVVVANLEPRMMMGLESQGMLLAVDFKKPVLLKPAQKVPPGTQVR